MSCMLRLDNVSRRTDESDSELVVTEQMSVTAHDVFSKGIKKSSGEFEKKYDFVLFSKVQATKSVEFYGSFDCIVYDVI